MSTNLVEFAREYSGAWAVHDPAAIAAMHTDDSVFELHDVGAPATGRAAVRELIEALLTIVPDLRFEPKRAHFGAEHFVTEYMMSGTAERKPFAISGADAFANGFAVGGRTRGRSKARTKFRKAPKTSSKSAIPKRLLAWSRRP